MPRGPPAEPDVRLTERAEAARRTVEYSAAAPGDRAGMPGLGRAGKATTPLILHFRLMVCSVLVAVQGHDTGSHADVTDRDRDESSRRAVSAWVRMSPLTHVR